MLNERWVECPYCGEDFETLVDGSAGSQSYIEDCPVCCRPIEFQAEAEADGAGDLINLTTRRDDD
ncbi:MAG TPA: CPXCG motif-containing cysteine-rich protein [Lamprocystis sp. (in: g-proteobacteria)]|nr:CPXCG motif-containing cysteine-rich protein [Lamprocystis sp. (in: g-proteobacteria)]